MSSTLGGASISAGRYQIGEWGVPYGDVELQTPLALTVGQVTELVIEDTTHTVAVISGGVYESKASYRVCGGRGKWGKTIPRKSYGDSFGSRIAKIVGDAAAACGEVSDVPPTARFYGEQYARPEGPARDVLQQVAPNAWYVDAAGTTRLGKRATAAYTSAAPRVHVDLALGKISLAVESTAGLLPGVVVDGLAPATDVEFELSASRTTVHVWGGPSSTSRLVGAIANMVRAECARYRFAGTFEFRVVTQDADRLNLQPVRTGLGFSDLPAVPIRPGIAGWRGNVQLGSLVLVTFVDMDPSRPVVVSHDAPDAPGWMPLTSELGGPAPFPVALVGPTLAGPFILTGGSVRVKASL